MKHLRTEGLTSKKIKGKLYLTNSGYILKHKGKEYEVTTGTQKGNYKQLYIPNLSGKKNILIREHRLLAFNFCAFPEGFTYSTASSFEVHHKDGNRLNNSIDNLEILSRSEHRALTAQEKSYTVDVTTLHNNHTYTFTGLSSAAEFCKSSASKISKYRNGGVLTGKGVYVVTYTE